MNEAERFGRRIADARNALGLTQEDLSGRLGKGGSVSAIQKWERGDNLPGSRMQAKIRTVLGIPGDPAETQSEWSPRVQALTETLGDLISGLPADELRRWRSVLIRRFVTGDTTRANVDWPEDAETIIEIIGACLSLEPSEDQG